MLKTATDVIPPTTTADFNNAINQALRARAHGYRELEFRHVLVAESLLKLALPILAEDISKVASRKGESGAIGRRVAEHVTPRTAAAVVSVWMLRRSRQAAIEAVAGAFKNAPEFDDEIRLLFRHALMRGLVWRAARSLDGMSLEEI